MHRADDLALLLLRLGRRGRRSVYNYLRGDRLHQGVGDGGDRHETSERVHRRVVQVRSRVDSSRGSDVEKLANCKTLRSNQLLGPSAKLALVEGTANDAHLSIGAPKVAINCSGLT